MTVLGNVPNVDSILLRECQGDATHTVKIVDLKIPVVPINITVYTNEIQ